MAANRVIPIKVAVGGAAAAAEDAHLRLERAGFMRMMALAEPRLTEFVARYTTLGYEVELVPYAEDDGGGAAIGGSATLYVRKRRPPDSPGLTELTEPASSP